MRHIEIVALYSNVPASIQLIVRDMVISDKGDRELHPFRASIHGSLCKVSSGRLHVLSRRVVSPVPQQQYSGSKE